MYMRCEWPAGFWLIVCWKADKIPISVTALEQLLCGVA